MKTINEHIRNHTFKQVYLICGPEDYLRRQYRDKLRRAILPEEDSVNYHYFSGKGIDIRSVRDLADTMPFFAEYRLIIIEESGFFSSAAGKDLVDYMKEIPDTTIFLFVERTIDQRTQLYKAVAQAGYVAKMEHPDEQMLTRWVEGMLTREGRQISRADLRLLLSMIDTDMENICQEVEKLICYTYGRQKVTAEDITAVCCTHAENQVFRMVDAIAAGDRDQAFAYYEDLVTLREKPLRILALITRQFNLLFQIREQISYGLPYKEIARRTGIRDFVVRKNLELAKRFTRQQLQEAIEMCVQTEEDIKTGNLDEHIGVELLILTYTGRY